MSLIVLLGAIFVDFEGWSACAMVGNGLKAREVMKPQVFRAGCGLGIGRGRSSSVSNDSAKGEETVGREREKGDEMVAAAQA